MSNAQTVTAQPSFATFIDVLSDEFVSQTGVGVYAHISTVDAIAAYSQQQLSGSSMRAFAGKYVREF